MLALATSPCQLGFTRSSSEQRASLRSVPPVGHRAGTWTCPTTKALSVLKRPDRTINLTGPSHRQRESFVQIPGSTWRQLCDGEGTKRGFTLMATQLRREGLVQRIWTIPG